MQNSSYTLSARAKQITNLPVMEFIRVFYPGIPFDSVDSVFGFVEQTPLYGGRPFQFAELTDDDVRGLYDHGIGLRLPLSNHNVSWDEFKEAKPFLLKYHRAGNTVIATNDDFARWIRDEYPLYEIEASAIKNIDNLTKLTGSWELYHTAVLPAKCNDDLAFLKNIKHKDRIRLFLNAGCAYNCPSKICYPSMSSMNKYNGAQFMCSQPLIPREVKMHGFDEAMLVGLGFRKFKVLRRSTVTAY